MPRYGAVEPFLEPGEQVVAIGAGRWAPSADEAAFHQGQGITCLTDRRMLHIVRGPQGGVVVAIPREAIRRVGSSWRVVPAVGMEIRLSIDPQAVTGKRVPKQWSDGLHAVTSSFLVPARIGRQIEASLGVNGDRRPAAWRGARLRIAIFIALSTASVLIASDIYNNTVGILVK